MPFSRSRSIESSTRSAISARECQPPACRNMASTRVVLPWSTWAMMATLRRSERVGMIPILPGRRRGPGRKPKPVQVAAPPPTGPQGPPPRSPAPGASCPTYTGPVAPRSDVAAAISSASGHAFNPTLGAKDPNPPAIKVRLALIQGMAWEETSWQSTIVSCDGGVGTMQVMQTTADWMNAKYRTGYDFHTLTGNVMVG